MDESLSEEGLIRSDDEVLKETESEAKEMKRRLELRFPDTETVIVDGLQPIYDYIMILE